MKVLILGCGPAGLMAMHAAVAQGHEVMCFSKARKSHMRGAQYLHRPIPGVSREPFVVDYQLRGEPWEYRRKVYGSTRVETVSPEDLIGQHKAWDIREAYDFLWDAYGSSVAPVDLDGSIDVQRLSRWADPDLFISTVPAPLLCERPEEHSFQQQTIWSSDIDFGVEDNTVICNGTGSPAWYRSAKIQGWSTVEWPFDSKPPISVHLVPKPTRTNCDCLPRVHRMGRYGKWEKGVLSHEAFYQTMDLINQPIQEELPL